MDILFVSAYFPPEIGAPANRVYELSRRWAARGHRVRVLTGFPNHPAGQVPEDYRRKMSRVILQESVDGIDVTRVWLCTAPNRTAWQRIANYTSFGISTGSLGLFLRKPSVVLATSPHLLTGLAGWWLARAFGIPFVLEIRDLWPESLTASGVSTEKSFLIRSLRRLARFLYDRADRLVAVTEAIAEVLEKDWRVPPERLRVLPHTVDGARFCPGDASPWPPGMEDLNGYPVVSYIGTLGQAHGLSTLLEAARSIASQEPALRLVLIGEGADKENLRARAAGHSSRNVRFIPQQPWSQIPKFIRRSALCVALLKPGEVFRTALPTKVLEYLACGKPVVLAADGHARRVLEESGGGQAVEPGNAQQLAQAILSLIRNPTLSRRYGEQGRRYVLEHFDPDRVARDYAALLQETVSSCHPRTS